MKSPGPCPDSGRDVKNTFNWKAAVSEDRLMLMNASQNYSSGFTQSACADLTTYEQ